MHVGYIGLGAMGSTLARRLLRAQMPLTVWDRNPVAAQSLAAHGATVAPNAAALAKGCDVILLCLPRTADVRELVLGPQGIAHVLRPGTIVVDQTSGSPEQTQCIADELAPLGVKLLDAPVSGSPPLFEAGGGTVMLSGTDADAVLTRVMPTLERMGRLVLRCGNRIGDAQAMKLINNTINTGFRIGTLEAVAMARKAGYSLQAIVDALNEAGVHNGTTRLMLPALLQGRSSTDFALELMLKDLSLSTGLGAQHGAPMPIAELVRGVLQVGVNTLGPGARLEDVVKLIETLAGTSIAGVVAHDQNALPGPVRAAIASTVAACNYAVTWEATLMGLKYGLTLPNMASVINASSGGSSASESSLSILASGTRAVRHRLGEIRQGLALGRQLSSEVSAPLLIGSAARSVFEEAALVLDESADLGQVIDLLAARAALVLPTSD